MATSKSIMLYLVITTFLPIQNALHSAPGCPDCRAELTTPHARRTYLIGRFIPRDEGICTSKVGQIMNSELCMLKAKPHPQKLFHSSSKGWLALARHWLTPGTRHEKRC
jgi:hypothetical protein